VPLDLQPLSPDTQSLAPVGTDAQALVPHAADEQALVPLDSFDPTPEIVIIGTLPGANTFPDDILCAGLGVLVGQHLVGEGDTDLFPADNDVTPATGLELVSVGADTQTLTALQED
jgi:hypothetical protein